MMTGNIMDYLEWYGDFDFSVMPFNEAPELYHQDLQSSAMQVLMV